MSDRSGVHGGKKEVLVKDRGCEDLVVFGEKNECERREVVAFR